MFATPIDVSNLGTAVGSTTASAASSKTDPDAAQDRFLTLLVAQINSQDPLNPMDNAQMTSQMAQISTVQGIEQLNATLKGMSAQYGAMQAMQGTSLIGRQALVEGNTLSFDGAVGKGALSLDSAALKVSVDIVGKNGALIDTVDLGSLGAGQHAFDWNTAGLDPSTVAGFSIRATTGGQPIAATPLARLSVTSVSFSSGAMSLQLQDGRSLGYDQIRSFM
jgi:flagellar basal-body rod modification protein FlgD